MVILNLILKILLALSALALVILVLLQEDKNENMGAVTGGSDTFSLKSKNASREAALAKLTSIIAVMFVVLTIIVIFIQRFV